MRAILNRSCWSYGSAQGSEDKQPHDVTGYTRDQLINDLLNRYARFRLARRLP